ncbi:putative protease [Candidatus Electrothrix aarhusensis]|uniref:Putative protease n=1 Tax=Candidatus Electrothrix aarhusensis TaxID=1859131 RepID=A0A444J3I4_9BACT|nr:putative protease [Candidatus Electrothrix aarhusensis]
MTKHIELLAPGGDIDCIKAAIAAGADAIYCGLDKFNARNRAQNIDFANLQGILRLAHASNCQIFLTLNIIIVESEIPPLIRLLNKLVKTKIDGVIVQDFGMLYLLGKYFPGLKIHASTQLTTHNEDQVKFLSKLKATRVNLSRELSLDEIQSLASTGHENNMLTEVFVHGSYCISFSGLCYFSSVHGGKSGNRGRCSQPCRDQYVTTAVGKDFPLNLKDNSAYADLQELADAGVDSVKIEGRIKKFHYVYTVVDAWKKQLLRLDKHDKLITDKHDLHKVFNREFSNGFLAGDINKSMFIDNSRDNSAIRRAEIKGGCTDENIQQAKRELYDLKTEIIQTVQKDIARLSIAKAPLTLTVSGEVSSPLKLAVQTPDTSFTVFSDRLAQKNKHCAQGLNTEILLEKFKALNDTEYFIQHIDGENLQDDLFLPFKDLTIIQKKILCILNGTQGVVAPVEVPLLDKPTSLSIRPTLSLLISSVKDLHHLTSLIRSNAIEADIYFQLPQSFKNKYAELRKIFTENNIIPWFPSVLIGEDYRDSVEFLHQLQPQRPQHIVTDNTGIAYEAYQKGIAWIAGPTLNIVNSFSLLCLKEHFNCSGAFISNEISKIQIKGIKKPDDFKLYYSIYHPINLVTSRQCLFHQVTGCHKDRIDTHCIQHCEKTSSIKNLKGRTLFIKKTQGNYHRIYNEVNFLNTDIVTDVPNLFSSFFIDLRNITTKTNREVDTATLIKLFGNYLNGDFDAAKSLKQSLHPTTDIQYKKGI